MPKKHGTTTTQVYEYLSNHPGASLDEMATDLKLPSRSNVRYHLLKLAAMGMVDLPIDGKHRQFAIVRKES
jgi:predicted ArsR family transcriptional regulator